MTTAEAMQMLYAAIELAGWIAVVFGIWSLVAEIRHRRGIRRPRRLHPSHTTQTQASGPWQGLDEWRRRRDQAYLDRRNPPSGPRREDER